MSESLFKVYRGSYLTCFGTPTVIVTADQIMKPTLYSEYFVFIEGENSLFWGGTISVNTNNAPEHIISDEINFSIDEALLQAQTSLSLRQSKYFQSRNIELWQRDKIELMEIDKATLSRIWRSGKFEKQLQYIKENSKSKLLQNYMKVLEGVTCYSYSEF